MSISSEYLALVSSHQRTNQRHQLAYWSYGTLDSSFLFHTSVVIFIICNQIFSPYKVVISHNLRQNMTLIMQASPYARRWPPRTLSAAASERIRREVRPIGVYRFDWDLGVSACMLPLKYRLPRSYLRPPRV